tara:strand:- start:115 stop:285 length:171 start_codon:yes stop_codon:yes gene_type:complete
MVFGDEIKGPWSKQAPWEALLNSNSVWSGAPLTAFMQVIAFFSMPPWDQQIALKFT